MEFIISKGTLVLNKQEILPIYSMLLDYLNYSLSNIDLRRKRNVPTKLMWKFKFNIGNSIPSIKHKLIDELFEFKYSKDYEAANRVQQNIDELNDEKKYINEKFEQLQNEIRELVNNLFIENKLNEDFGGIDVDGIHYRIFYSCEDNYFGEIYETENLEAFLLFSIIKCLEYGIKINKCENCGKYFVPLTRNDEIYCDNVFSNGRTCKQIGYENKIKNDDILKEYRRVYKNKNAYKQRTKNKNPNAEAEFKKWVYAAKFKLDDCREGKITIEEFKEWLERK